MNFRMETRHFRTASVFSQTGIWCDALCIDMHAEDLEWHVRKSPAESCLQSPAMPMLSASLTFAQMIDTRVTGLDRLANSTRSSWSRSSGGLNSSRVPLVPVANPAAAAACRGIRLAPSLRLGHLRSLFSGSRTLRPIVANLERLRAGKPAGIIFLGPPRGGRLRNGCGRRLGRSSQ